MGKKSPWDKIKKAVTPAAQVLAVPFTGAVGLANAIPGVGKKASEEWNSIQGKDHASHSAEKNAKKIEDNENAQYAKNQDYAKTLASQDQSSLGVMQGNVGKYQTDLDQLRSETEASQKDASATYSNQIQPRLKGLMEQNQRNAAGAMSLQEAMDPNNKVAQGTRDLYERQAKNEGRQGLGDAATLQALGAQNFASQAGNAGPMTGGQLAALMGQNSAQSGAAYSRSLSRQHDLRDQGLSQGFARSDIAYGQGRDAQDRYGRSINNYESASDRQLGRDKDFRSQRSGLAGQSYGLQQQMSDASRGAGQSATQRDMAIYNTHMGGNQANIASQIAQTNAGQARDAQMVTGGLTAAGTVAGAVYGGPAGGVAGGAAGNAAGNAMAPEPNATPGYGNYGSASPQNPNPSMQEQNIGIQNYMNANGGGYSYGGNGAQMGPPATSYAGSSGGSQGVTEGGQGLGLYGRNDRRGIANRMRS